MTISIITVCKNSEQFLQETIDSVAGQTYPHIQYIVIDGQSTDRTVGIIKANENKISYWASSPDSGMYDAINKGLAMATGEYILILNSDDLLADSNVIQKLADETAKDRLGYYYGNMVKLKNGQCKKVKLFNASYQQLLLSTHGTFAPHPCFFISAALNRSLGGYSLAYRYASDYDYILRALSVKNSSGRHINMYVSKFRMHENSITASGKINSERLAILHAHGYYKIPRALRFFVYYTLWIYYKMINAGQKFRAGCI